MILNVFILEYTLLTHRLFYKSCCPCIRSRSSGSSRWRGQRRRLRNHKFFPALAWKPANHSALLFATIYFQFFSFRPSFLWNINDSGVTFLNIYRRGENNVPHLVSLQFRFSNIKFNDFLSMLCGGLLHDLFLRACYFSWCF